MVPMAHKIMYRNVSPTLSMFPPSSSSLAPVPSSLPHLCSSSLVPLPSSLVSTLSSCQGSSSHC